MTDVMLEKLEAKETKKIWQSKTLWLSFFSAAAALIPGADVWVKANSETFVTGLALVFALLRFVSKDKIVIK